MCVKKQQLEPCMEQLIDQDWERSTTGLSAVTLPTKVYMVKSMVFPVVMHGCENWTIKKAECQRIDAFKLWC